MDEQTEIIGHVVAARREGDHAVDTCLPATIWPGLRGYARALVATPDGPLEMGDVKQGQRFGQWHRTENCFAATTPDAAEGE